jgi:hypothetical protein
VRDCGDVIIGSDETTIRVQAEACAELALYANTNELQIGNRKHNPAEILVMWD